MGFDLNAFLGRTSDLQAWTKQLPSVTVCELSGELGLVPVTGKVFHELRTLIGEDAANDLDAEQSYPTYPSPSHEEGVRYWGSEASWNTSIAYISVGEFGDQSYEKATLWSDGRQVLSGVTVGEILDYFREQIGLDLGTKPINLEQHRGEDAAEKWADSASNIQAFNDS
jgi:hypothetical protein